MATEADKATESVFNFVVPSTRVETIASLRALKMDKIRISHQPNFLAYWKLLGQFEYANSIARELRMPQRQPIPIVYVVNDYDAWSDERLRRAEFPLLAGQGTKPAYVNLRANTKTPRQRVFSHLGSIPDEFPAQLRAAVDGYFTGFRELLPPRQRGRFRRISREVVGDVVKLLERSDSWPEFSVSYIRLCLDWMGVNSFETISGFKTFIENQNQIREMATRLAGEDSALTLGKILWKLCSGCWSRSPLSSELNSREVCTYCDRSWDPADGLVLPKILLDNLLDDVLYPGTVSFAHTGGFEHILRSQALRRRHNLLPTTFDVISDQGTRTDRTFRYVAAAAANRPDSGEIGANVREIYDRARLGYFSSLYYFIGDAFESPWQ